MCDVEKSNNFGDVLHALASLWYVVLLLNHNESALGLCGVQAASLCWTRHNVEPGKLSLK